MAERIVRQLVAEQAIVLPEPALRLPTAVDRNFELPAGLYVDAAVEGAALDRIGAARDAVAAQVEQQDETISGLSAGLR